MDSDLMYSLGMANSAIQYAGAQIGAVDDKKWIDKQNEKSREFQLQMWNKANEYNLPVNTVERLRNAGLNPALMYSNGPGSLMAETVSAPGHSAPNMGSAQNANQRAIAMAQMAMQRELQDSNIAVNESVITKNIAEANQAENLGEKYNLENYVSRETLKTQIDSTIETYRQLLNSGKIQDEKLQQEIQKKLQELERTRQEIEHTKQEQEHTSQEINETARSAEAVKTQEATTRNINQSTSTLAAQAENYRVDSRLKKSQMRVNDATIEMMRKQGIKTDAEANQILVDTYNAVLDGRLNRLLNSTSRRYGTGMLGTIIGAGLDTFGITLDSNGKISIPGVIPLAKRFWQQLTPIHQQLAYKLLKQKQNLKK